MLGIKRQTKGSRGYFIRRIITSKNGNYFLIEGISQDTYGVGQDDVFEMDLNSVDGLGRDDVLQENVISFIIAAGSRTVIKETTIKGDRVLCRLSRLVSVD